MKRSHRIILVLLGGASAGALAGCSRSPRPVRISPESVYVNDYFVPGVGYYHAPFHRFYALPYNYYDPNTRRYFFGGEWASAPNQSTVNISAPTDLAAQFAELNRTDVVRGGFGSYYHGGS